MLYRLIILNGALKGQRHSVGLGPLVIGSSTECDICLTGDDAVAREHVRVEVEGSILKIQDLGTVNRILVNKREVSEATAGHGDVVAIGGTELMVHACVEADILGETRSSGRKHRTAWMWILLIALVGLGVYRFRKTTVSLPPPDEVPGISKPVADTEPESREPVVDKATAEELQRLRQALYDLRQAVRDMEPASQDPAPGPVDVPSPETLREERIIREIQAASEAFEDGREDEALARLTVLLADDPDVLRAYELRARIYEKQGNIDKAIGQWAQILRRGGSGNLGARAEHERNRLAAEARRRSLKLNRSVRIRSHSLHKFQASEEYDEMRLLNIEVETSPPAASTADHWMQVLFFDRRVSDGRIGLTEAVGTRNRIPLDFHRKGTGPLTVTVPYVSPRGNGSRSAASEGEVFYGYIIRVYTGDHLEDEAARPESLLTAGPVAGRRPAP